jgi:hypothetical protein
MGREEAKSQEKKNVGKIKKGHKNLEMGFYASSRYWCHQITSGVAKLIQR